MKKSKGIAFIWAILLVLLVGVVAAAGTYFGAKWYQNYKAKQEAKKLESQDKTATWNTYLNDQLYFTFKYPQGWTYEQTKWTDENWKKSRSFKLTFKPEDFVIEANPWSASMAVLTHAFDGYTKTSTETVKVDSTSATYEIWDTNAKGKELYKEDYQSIVYKITHDADDITIYFNYKKASETERFENFKLLMSTFKWTKTTGNANTNSSTSEIDSWQTYTNSDVGYKLKYPKGWAIKETNEQSQVLDKPVKYIKITSTAKNQLYFGIKKAGDESFGTTDRTGIGAGEDVAIAGKETTLVGATMIPKKHVWQSKTKEIFYFEKTEGDLTKTCKCDANIWFDPPEGSNSDTVNMSLSEVDTVNKILASVQWL